MCDLAFLRGSRGPFARGRGVFEPLGPLFLTWKVRWFVACEKEILYYSSRDDSDPARRIPMQDVMEVGWAKRDDEGGFCACSLLATK